MRKGQLDGQANYRSDALMADNLKDVLPCDGHKGGCVGDTVAEAQVLEAWPRHNGHTARRGGDLLAKCAPRLSVGPHPCGWRTPIGCTLASASLGRLTRSNRWLTTAMLAASASSNETALLTWKVVRSFGMVVFDNQARV